MWNHLSRRQMNEYKFRRQHSVDEYVRFLLPWISLPLKLMVTRILCLDIKNKIEYDRNT